MELFKTVEPLPGATGGGSLFYAVNINRLLFFITVLLNNILTILFFQTRVGEFAKDL